MTKPKMSITEASKRLEALMNIVKEENYKPEEQVLLFYAIGRYKFLGGHRNYIKEIRTNGILDKTAGKSDKDRSDYMGYVIAYTMAGEVYIAFLSLLMQCANKNWESLLAFSRYLSIHLDKTLERYDLEIRYVDKVGIMLLKEGKCICTYRSFEEAYKGLIMDSVVVAANVHLNQNDVEMLKSLTLEMF